MHKVTVGNMLHLYGRFANKSDYAVRLSVRMTDNVDGEILSRALASTQQRFPFFSVRIKRNDHEYYYEENPLPVVLLRTDEKISLNTEQTNNHIWAVCYSGDRIHLDIYHGITDGTGMYFVFSTLLFYYCAERYGITDHTGILTLEDPVMPEESEDPQENLPAVTPAAAQGADAFQAGEYAHLTPSGQNIWDIEMPEEAFMRFTSANDASPGTMISLLMARAIDSLFPERREEIINSYLVNARPMLGAPRTLHNCFSTAYLKYSDRVKAMPFDHQCTSYRGMTFVQTDSDYVVRSMAAAAAVRHSAAAGAPLLEDKKRVFAELLKKRGNAATFAVSYVGKWRFPEIGKHIREFWTHVPYAHGFLIQIAAVNGRIFLSMIQTYKEDLIVEAFLRELEKCHIPYKVHRHMDNDAAAIPEPV